MLSFSMYVWTVNSLMILAIKEPFRRVAFSPACSNCLKRCLMRLWSSLRITMASVDISALLGA